MRDDGGSDKGSSGWSGEDQNLDRRLRYTDIDIDVYLIVESNSDSIRIYLHSEEEHSGSDHRCLIKYLCVTFQHTRKPIFLLLMDGKISVIWQKCKANIKINTREKSHAMISNMMVFLKALCHEPTLC